MVQWDDDSYSHDLTDGFEDARRTTGGDDGADTPVRRFPDRADQPRRIASSVGSFLTPNRFEAEVGRATWSRTWSRTPATGR